MKPILKNLVSILLASLIVMGGCSKNNQPTQYQNTSTDQSIKTSIIGQWKCGSSYNLTFSADSTFIDSISFAVDSPNPPKYELFYVVKGTFSVNNGILNFPKMELVFADTTHLLSFTYFESYVFNPLKIEFKNETLLLRMMDVLSPLSSDGKVLNGNWQTENWIVQVERRPTTRAFFGKLIKEYQFDEYSKNYKYNISNTFGSAYQVQSDSGSFTYTKEDRLTFGNTVVEPTLTNGKLLMYYFFTFEYKKIK